jgi:hypothetical protein
MMKLLKLLVCVFYLVFDHTRVSANEYFEVHDLYACISKWDGKIERLKFNKETFNFEFRERVFDITATDGRLFLATGLRGIDIDLVEDIYSGRMPDMALRQDVLVFNAEATGLRYLTAFQIQGITSVDANFHYDCEKF